MDVWNEAFGQRLGLQDDHLHWFLNLSQTYLLLKSTSLWLHLLVAQIP